MSGGGYTGTAYLDWKYRNGKKDDNEWHDEFFNHTRQSAGFICHCNKPLFQTILDFLAITLVILFVSFLVPALNLLSFSYPLAFVVDWLFGDTLRKETPYCDEDVPNLTTVQRRTRVIWDRLRAARSVFDAPGMHLHVHRLFSAEFSQNGNIFSVSFFIFLLGFLRWCFSLGS